MCFGGKKNQDPGPQEATKLTIIHTPPPPEPVEKFPSPELHLNSRTVTHDEGFLVARSLTKQSLPPPDRPRTPTHNKRSSRGTALIERNRLSDIDPHEVERASHGDLGEDVGISALRHADSKFRVSKIQQDRKTRHRVGFRSGKCSTRHLTDRTRGKVLLEQIT